MKVPAFGLGTFRVKGDTVVQSVRTALELGYRAVDTAQIYDNESEVGEGIRQSGVPRSAVFVTTKIWVDRLDRSKLTHSLQTSLQKLSLDQVDLTLIHWPSPRGAVPLNESLDALLAARDLGLTRFIGVSNFTIALLQQAFQCVGRESIATNQVEISPFLQNRKLAQFAQSQGLHLTSYTTLARGKVAQDPVLLQIAHQHSATPEQVALAWVMQQGHSVIPSSTNPERLRSNLAACDLHLSAEDCAAIDQLDRNERHINPADLAPSWD